MTARNMIAAGSKTVTGVVAPGTFQIRSGTSRMTLTFTRDGHLVTTYEYGGVLVKRVSVQATQDEARELMEWLADNLAVQPFPSKEGKP